MIHNNIYSFWSIILLQKYKIISPRLTQLQRWPHCPHRQARRRTAVVCAVWSRQWSLWKDSTSTYNSWTPQSQNTCWAIDALVQHGGKQACFHRIPRIHHLSCFLAAAKYGDWNWLRTVFVSISNAAPYFFLKWDLDLGWTVIFWWIFSPLFLSFYPMSLETWFSPETLDLRAGWD